MEEGIRNIPYLIDIDHHSGNVPFGDICWVEETASSTCEMLYDLSEALPLTLDREIAEQLYTGLLTDTGSFRFSNTTHRVMEIASRLVAAGGASRKHRAAGLRLDLLPRASPAGQSAFHRLVSCGKNEWQPRNSPAPCLRKPVRLPRTARTSSTICAR